MSVITQMIRPYTHEIRISIVLLQGWRMTQIIQWFANNFMKLNTDKCHLMVLGRNSNQKVTVNVGNSVIENTEEEKVIRRCN